MATTLAEIWQRCSEIKERLRWRGPSFEPFPGVLRFHGVGKVTPANYAKPPQRATVRFVLARLLDAAERTYDFETQREILELMQDLEDAT